MKLRVIVNGVSFYTTSTAIKQRRVGDFSFQNDALYYALDLMGKHAGIGTTGTGSAATTSSSSTSTTSTS